MWSIVRRQLPLLFAAVTIAALATDVSGRDMEVDETVRLIRLSERGVENPGGWAMDLLDVLRDHDFPRSRENICASVAVIDQESSFRADPAVPGLGKISESALREKFGRIPVAGHIALNLLESSPSPDDSYMSRIRNARTERDLDMAYRSFIDDASKRTTLDVLVNSGILNGIIEEGNNIKTAGSMQVSVKFAVETSANRRWLPAQLDDVYAVRDTLYTRRGGMYYGVLQLLGYDSGYAKKIYRFADYNAGRYASRNAAYQQALSRLAKAPLDLDGDLLLYGKNGPKPQPSTTELAARQVGARYKLGLSDKRIRSDLLEEKLEKFTATRTFNRVRDAYFQEFGSLPPFAVVPKIKLDSPKINRQMTTEIFAKQVNRKYQACMKF